MNMNFPNNISNCLKGRTVTEGSTAGRLQTLN